MTLVPCCLAIQVSYLTGGQEAKNVSPLGRIEAHFWSGPIPIAATLNASRLTPPPPCTPLVPLGNVLLV